MWSLLLKFSVLSVGAVCGAGLRYGLSLCFSTASLPVATIVANTLGCFVLGLVWQYKQMHGLSELASLLLMLGFCASLTTFSTIILDSLLLINAAQWLKAVAYFFLTTLLGFLALILATVVMRVFY